MHLYYPNGSLYGLITEDKRTYFYPDGALKTQEIYFQGRLETVELYWPNQQIKRKCSFLLGVRHGLDQMWSESGVLLDDGTYVDGKPVGKHRRWSSSGRLIEEVEYLEGRFELRRWDERGVLCQTL